MEKEAFKKLRKEIGYKTQRALAKDVGVSAVSIHNIEAGYTKVDPWKRLAMFWLAHKNKGKARAGENNG